MLSYAKKSVLWLKFGEVWQSHRSNILLCLMVITAQVTKM